MPLELTRGQAAKTEMRTCDVDVSASYPHDHLGFAVGWKLLRAQSFITKRAVGALGGAVLAFADEFINDDKTCELLSVDVAIVHVVVGPCLVGGQC